MPKEVDARALLKGFDATLSAVQGELRGRASLPEGTYHGVLSGVDLGIREDKGRNIPYLQMKWKVLAAAGRGNALNGRTHSQFVGLDPKAEGDADRKAYKGLVKAIGLPETFQNSAEALVEYFG